MGWKPCVCYFISRENMKKTSVLSRKRYSYKPTAGINTVTRKLPYRGAIKMLIIVAYRSSMVLFVCLHLIPPCCRVNSAVAMATQGGISWPTKVVGIGHGPQISPRPFPEDNGRHGGRSNATCELGGLKCKVNGTPGVSTGEIPRSGVYGFLLFD